MSAPSSSERFSLAKIYGFGYSRGTRTCQGFDSLCILGRSRITAAVVQHLCWASPTTHQDHLLHDTPASVQHLPRCIGRDTLHTPSLFSLACLSCSPGAMDLIDILNHNGPETCPPTPARHLDVPRQTSNSIPLTTPATDTNSACQTERESGFAKPAATVATQPEIQAQGRPTEHCEQGVEIAQ